MFSVVNGVTSYLRPQTERHDGVVKSRVSVHMRRDTYKDNKEFNSKQLDFKRVTTDHKSTIKIFFFSALNPYIIWPEGDDHKPLYCDRTLDSYCCHPVVENKNSAMYASEFWQKYSNHNSVIASESHTEVFLDTNLYLIQCAALSEAEQGPLIWIF